MKTVQIDDYVKVGSQGTMLCNQHSTASSAGEACSEILEVMREGMHQFTFALFEELKQMDSDGMIGTMLPLTTSRTSDGAQQIIYMPVYVRLITVPAVSGTATVRSTYKLSVVGRVTDDVLKRAASADSPFWSVDIQGASYISLDSTFPESGIKSLVRGAAASLSVLSQYVRKECEQLFDCPHESEPDAAPLPFSQLDLISMCITGHCTDCIGSQMDDYDWTEDIVLL